MKIKQIISLLLIFISLQLCSADIETHPINIGQFTPIVFSNRNTIQFLGDLDLSSDTTSQTIYINIQNPYLFDGLQFQIKNGNTDVSSGDVISNSRVAYNLGKFQCAQNTHCTYSVLFNLKDGVQQQNTAVSQVQFIQKTTQQNIPTYGDFTVYPNLNLKVDGITDFPRLAQNVMVPGSVATGHQAQIQYQYLINLNDYNLNQHGYAAVMSNNPNADLNLNVAIKKIKASDINDSSKWPTPKILLTDNADYSKNSNAEVLPSIETIDKGYLAVSVIVKIENYDPAKKYSFIIQVSQISQHEVSEMKIDKSTNKLIHGSQTNRLSEDSFLTSYLTHLEQTDKASQFRVYYAKTSDILGAKQLAGYDVQGFQRQLNQFIDLNAKEDFQFFFFSFANPELQTGQKLRISYSINPNNIINASSRNKPFSYNKITQDSQQLLFFVGYDLNSNDDILQQTVRFSVNDNLDQTKLTVQYQFVDENSVENANIPVIFSNSKTYDQLDCYTSTDCTSKVLKFSNVNQHLIGSQTSTFLMVKIIGDFTQAIEKQKLYFQLHHQTSDDIHYFYENYYLSQHFPTQLVEQTLKKSYLTSKSGILSASNDLSQTDIKYTVSLGDHNYPPVTLNHNDYNQQYSVANISETDINSHCSADDCVFKILIDTINYDSKKEYDSESSTSVMLRFQQHGVWDQISAPYSSQSQLISKQQKELQVFKYYVFTLRKKDTTLISVSIRDFSESNQVCIQKVDNSSVPILTEQQFQEKIKSQPFQYNNVLAFDQCMKDSCEHHFYVYFNFKTSSKSPVNCFFINAQSYYDTSFSKITPGNNIQLGLHEYATYRPIQKLIRVSLSRTSFLPSQQFFYQYSFGEEQDQVGELSSVYLYGWSDENKQFQYVESFNHLQEATPHQLVNPDRLYMLYVLSNPIYRKTFPKYQYATVRSVDTLHIGEKNGYRILQNDANTKFIIDLKSFSEDNLSISFSEKQSNKVKLTYKQSKQGKNMKYPNPIGQGLQNDNIHDFSKNKVATIPIDKSKDYLLMNFYFEEKGIYKIDVVDGTKKSSSPTVWIVIIVVILVILVIAAVIYFMQKKKRKQQSQLQSLQPLTYGNQDVENYAIK